MKPSEKTRCVKCDERIEKLPCEHCDYIEQLGLDDVVIDERGAPVWARVLAQRYRASMQQWLYGRPDPGHRVYYRLRQFGDRGAVPRPPRRKEEDDRPE